MASDRSQKALRQALELGDPGARVRGLICAAQAFGALGRGAEAESAFQDALRWQRESSNRHGALESLAVLAQVARVEGERFRRRPMPKRFSPT